MDDGSLHLYDEDGRLLQGMDVNWNADGQAQITYPHPSTPPSIEPKRLERLKIFFGISKGTEDQQTYREVLDDLLVEMSGIPSSEELLNWFASVTYDTMERQKPRHTNGGGHTRYDKLAEMSMFGTSPNEHDDMHGRNAFQEAGSTIYADFKARSVERTNHYEFFKFLYLSNSINHNDFDLQQMGKDWTQHRAHNRTRGRVGTLFVEGEKNFLNRKKNQHAFSWYEGSAAFLSSLKEPTELFKKKKLLESRLQPRIDILNGKGDLTTDGLFKLLGMALDEGSKHHKDELAQWLDIDTSSLDGSATGWAKALKDHFSSLVGSLNSEALASVESPLDILELLVGASVSTRSDAENQLQLYLYNTVADEGEGLGIYRKQDIASDGFSFALSEFIKKKGLLPADGLDMEALESALEAYNEASEESEESEESELSTASKALGALISTYLSSFVESKPETETDGRQKQLADMMDEYKELTLPGEEDLSRPLFAKTADLFGTILESHRIGEAFEDSAQEAWYRADFNKREVLLDLWSQDAALYTELNGGSIESSALASGFQLPRYLANLNAIYNSRMEAYKEVKKAERDIVVMDLKLQKDQWENQMIVILARGNMEWKLAKHRMKAKQTKWHQDFQESFQESLEAWELEYLVFFDKKSKWVIKTSEQAVQVGSQEVLSRFGKSTRDAIAEASSFVMPPDIAPPGDIKNLIVHILRPNVISNLLRGASNLQEGIGAIEPVILTDLGRDPYMTGEILDKIRAFQTEENEELLARLALVQYDKMLDTLDEAVKGLKATVDDANAASAGNFMKMLTRDNFRRKGRNYVKDTLVAVTLIGGLKYETHTIEGYKDYRVSIRDVSADMAVPDDSMIGELGFAGLQGLLKRALEGLEEEQERIFGGESTYINQWNQSHSETTYKERIQYFGERTTQSKEIERTRHWTTVEYDDSLSAKDYRSRLAAWDKLAASEKRQSRYVELRGGEFNRHSGYAPQFKSSPNSELSLGQWQENLQFEGLGEKGRIIGLYMQHQLIQAAGEGDFAKPFYARKIWDDRGDAFKSPTLRSVVEVVGAVAAAVASAASLGTATPLAVALIATGVGIADDVLFTALDIGTGYKEADEALLALGKKTLTSFATNLIGVGIRGGGMLEVGGNGVVESTKKAFEGLAGAMGEFGESAIGSTLLYGTQAISTNVVSSAINAIGSDNWGESFLEGAFGGNAMAGVVSGMMGSFVSGNLNHGFSQGDFGRAMGDWSSAHRGYLGDLSSTIGGVFSTTINYGLTGSASINLLNSSMFGLGNTGLLEMRFDRGGFSMQFGTGGTDLSVGRLVGAVRGINVVYQNERSLTYESTRNYDGSTYGYKRASALRSSYSFGGRSSRSQFDRIIRGIDYIEEGLPAGSGDRGRTIAADNGGRTVYLGYFGNDKSSRMRAAVILSHESYRDGITTDEVTQRQETQRAVRGHTETAIKINQDYDGKLPFWDENIEMDMMMYFLGDKAAFEAYADATYDSSSDNWKIVRKEDGSVSLMDDGSLHLYDEDGRLLQEYRGNGGLRGSLAYHLGLGDSVGAGNEWMAAAGWGWNKESGGYLVDGEAVRNNPALTLDLSDELRARYNIQYDYVDKIYDISSGYLGSMVIAMTTGIVDTLDQIMLLEDAGESVPGYLHEQVKQLQSLESFSDAWGKAMSMFDLQKFLQFASPDVVAAFAKLEETWDENLDTNEHYLYELAERVNPLGEVLGKKNKEGQGPPYFSGKEFYDFDTGENKLRHLGTGQAADLGTYHENLPIYTTQFESILMNSINLGFDEPGYGHYLKTYSGPFKMVKAHMQAETAASERLQALISSGESGGLFRITLPPGYQVGNVGNTGNSTNVHLHWEVWRDKHFQRY